MISIITVNYHTLPQIGRMLESLFVQQTSSQREIFVVNNALDENTNELQNRFPSVHFLQAPKNLGFAGGCNFGIAQANGDFFLLVNPDIEFDSDAPGEIETAMQQDQNVGVGGISLKNLDGTQQDCVWHFPTPLDQLLLLLKIPHLFPNTASIRRWLMKGFDYTKTTDVDQVMGAFFCIRRSVWKKIGPLDDDFFMWYEEVDFCKRAILTGWKVRYYAFISARHEKGSSFSSVNTFQKQAMIRRSLRRYMRKYYGWSGWLLFTLPEPLFITIAFLTHLIKPV
jgi:hypothetical protein